MKEADLKKQLRPNTPPAIVSLIAKQLTRAQEAQKRVEEEGIVVRDAKGSVMSHPAIAVEKEASKTAAELIAKWAKR